jgi:hypothetical protein
MRGGRRLALGGSTARLSTKALGSCFRRVICRGMRSENHLRQPHGGFFVAKGSEMWYSMLSGQKEKRKGCPK